MTFIQRSLIPVFLQFAFVVECVRVAAHLGPQHPSGAGEWGTLVGGVLVAVAAGGVLAVRVIGPGLRDAGERTSVSFW
jgi:hypothetical protein